jgi:hypothetical protein
MKRRVNAFPSYLFNIHFNPIPSSACVGFPCVSFFTCPKQTPLSIRLRFHACHLSNSLSFRHSWFCQLNGVCYGVQIKKVLIVLFSPVSCHLLSPALCSRTLLPQCEAPSLTAIKNWQCSVKHTATKIVEVVGATTFLAPDYNKNLILA